MENPLNYTFTVDGQWSAWQDWSECSDTCGNSGTQTKSRYCDNPLPQFGGQDCDGEDSGTQTCTPSPPPCPGKTTNV